MKFTPPQLALLCVLALSLSFCKIKKEANPYQLPTTSETVLGAKNAGNNYCNSCCTCTNAGTGTDTYKGKTLTDINFRGQDLTNYNFEGATLLGCRFDNMQLKDVSFKGAAFGAGTNGIYCSFASATLTNVCFVNAIIDSTDFQFTTFAAADFRCANIFNGKFGPILNTTGDTSSRTNFSYATVGVGEGNFLFPLDGLSQANWATTDFSNTKFLGLTPSKFHPKGKNMTDAKIAGINLEYFDLSQATLIRADLEGAKLSFSNMDSTICYGANFNNASLVTTSAINADFYDNTNGASTFLGANLTFSIMDSVDMEEVRFSGANLSGIQAKGGNFQRAIFIGAGTLDAALVSEGDFSYANFSNASVNQVDFSGVKLIGTKFENQSILSGTVFIGAIMPSVSFFGATLQDINFKGAYLFNADFSGSTLTNAPNGAGVSFECAFLGGSDLSATVNKANFFNAVIPPDTACCPQTVGVYCGLVPWTGNTYGHTTLPDLKAPFRCPNGVTDTCYGAEWIWLPKNQSLCADYWNDGSPWSKPADCNPHDTTDQVIIADPNLKKCLDNQLFKGQDQPISKALAATVSSINCSCQSIKTLSGLEDFTSLVYLNVENNELANGDFSNLSSLLQTIKVSDNQLGSIVFSSKQMALTNLEASGNKINQIQGTANIYFQLLDLSNNMLAGDWSAMLNVQTDLFYLDLSNNNLTSVGNLGTKQNLASIYLQNNNLTTIGSMKTAYGGGNGSLYNLDLQGNTCFQCNTLELPTSVVQAFNCSCDTKTCANCN